MSDDSQWRVTGVDHVGIAVPDLDEAIAFYERAFGMRCTTIEVNEEQGVREAMIEAGDGAQIQLLAPLGDDGPIGRFLAKRGPGMQQIAYAVTDLDAAAAALRGRGIELLHETHRPGTGGCRVNFIHPRDAGGVLVELVERR
ncbi:methylmalonyl-CoA epimerase [Actinoplanes sp. NPDC026619]|uniref:methylmalonyl-CoA epimerase n=1 Tax=Actinoplanes sp. NPDC026619 TaxID=3155798 RepID=UPI0034074F4F